MVNLYSKSNGFDGVYAICSFVILNLFSFSFVESYSIQNILLFIILFIAQIIYKDKIDSETNSRFFPGQPYITAARHEASGTTNLSTAWP